MVDRAVKGKLKEKRKNPPFPFGFTDRERFPLLEGRVFLPRGKAPQLRGRIPRLRGRVPQHGGRFPPLRGRVPPLGGGFPLLRGTVAPLRGRVSRLRARVHQLRGRPPPGQREIKPGRKFKGRQISSLGLHSFSIYGIDLND